MCSRFWPMLITLPIAEMDYFDLSIILISITIQDMNTNRQLIEQFLQFINTGDAAIGKPIISDDVIFYAPTSPEPMKGFEGYMGVLAMMRGAMPDIKWKIECDA